MALYRGIYPGRFAATVVDVLLRIYAKCIDGQHEIAKRRIAEALRDGAGDPAVSSSPGPPDGGMEAHDGSAD